MKIIEKLYSNFIFEKIINIFRTIHFNNQSVSLYVVGVIFLNKVKDNELKQKASSVAFNFTLAIFPFIIFLFTLIPYIPIEDFANLIFSFLSYIIPHNIMKTANSTIHDIIRRPRGGLLSIGFITALIMATNGMMGLINAFNSCYHLKDRRSFLKKQLIATFLTVILVIILFLAIVLLIAGKQILNTLVNYQIIHEYQAMLIDVIRFIVVTFAFFFTHSIIYYLAPGVPQRWKFVSIGSLIATALSIIISVLFSYYIDHFATYNKLYGSIGAMIGVMLWLFAISMVLLVGFEINSTIDIAKDKIKIPEKIKIEM